jgi:hypothetical protein
MLFLKGKTKFGNDTLWHAAGTETLLLCGYENMLSPYEATNELPERQVCQKCAIAVLGYEVKTVKAGQARRYGPTINTYIITDLRDNRSKDEVLDFCRTRLYPAKMKGEDGYHPLTPHVMTFRQKADRTWLYEAGREYTG